MGFFLHPIVHNWMLWFTLVYCVSNWTVYNFVSLLSSTICSGIFSFFRIFTFVGCRSKHLVEPYRVIFHFLKKVHLLDTARCHSVVWRMQIGNVFSVFSSLFSHLCFIYAHELRVVSYLFLLFSYFHAMVSFGFYFIYHLSYYVAWVSSRLRVPSYIT